MSSVDELRRLVDVAAGLVDDIQSQQQREAAALQEGYDLGHAAGVDVGRGQAETAMEEAWRPVAESVRRLGRILTRDELELRRWDGPREEFGRPRPGDYTGGPVPWNGRESAA